VKSKNRFGAVLEIQRYSRNTEIMEQFKGLQKSLYIWTDSADLDKRVEAVKAATGGEVALENVHRLSFCKLSVFLFV